MTLWLVGLAALLTLGGYMAYDKALILRAERRSSLLVGRSSPLEQSLESKTRKNEGKTERGPRKLSAEDKRHSVTSHSLQVPKSPRSSYRERRSKSAGDLSSDIPSESDRASPGIESETPASPSGGGGSGYSSRRAAGRSQTQGSLTATPATTPVVSPAAKPAEPPTATQAPEAVSPPPARSGGSAYRARREASKTQETAAAKETESTAQESAPAAKPAEPPTATQAPEAVSPPPARSGGSAYRARREASKTQETAAAKETESTAQESNSQQDLSF
eukprot:TRINITY_DN11798_c0_g1_i4.p1 TRINITY_DN11798_c0_g1~~TRINITY_DN11798_c0_g1_i4.p1  ORF type:complete len:276 (-),score=43.87 TRINITY_DN11798_c0_g1_i4:55-882(-)